MSKTSTVSEDPAGVSTFTRAGRRPFRTQMAAILVTRTVLNTAHRIIYPFLPSIARGLGISLTAASGLVTVRLLAGLAAPFFGPMTDRRGRRPTMELALVLFVLAGVSLVGAGSLPEGILVVAAGAFLLYGLAKVLYDPTVHAYLGDTVPYRERGRAIGLIELSWSAAWLIGVPVSGLLMEHFGWRAPWAVLAGLGLLCLGLTHVFLPAGRPAGRPGESSRGAGLLLSTWRLLLGRRRVIVLLLISLLLTMASEIPFIVYGAWLETSFGLSLSTLGLASIVVGLAEASAELGTTVLTDRLGKRRSGLAGLVAMAASLLLLPSLTQLGLAPAMAGIVLVTFSFEFAIVSLLPLATELAPEQRSSLLSLNVTAFSLGRIAGALIGGWLWSWQGERITPHAVVGAVCAAAAASLLFWGLPEIEEACSTVPHD
jgi:predicted MFS family arabinose efflux permease